MNEYLYDTTYDPPIPVCDVKLIAPAADRRVKLTAIVDTGADGTIVPIRYLRISARDGPLRQGCAANGANGVRSFCM